MFLDLPNELFYPIVGDLDHTDIYSLILTNRQFSRLLTPLLHNLACESSKLSATAFFWAAASGNKALVRLLLEKGDLGLRACNHKFLGPWGALKGKPASTCPQKGVLCLTSVRCSDYRVERVLRHGVNIVINRSDGEWGALGWALKAEREKLARLLLQKGVKRVVVGKFQGEALLVAMGYKSMRMIKMLLEEGVGVDSLGEPEGNVLLTVVKRGNEEAARLILGYGSDLGRRSVIDGLNLLSVAASLWDEAMVRLLLEKGADVRVRDESGCTSLHVAGDVGVGKILLGNGADINAKDNEGRTALQSAFMCGRAQKAHFLLEEGASMDFKDYTGPPWLEKGLSDLSEGGFLATGTAWPVFNEAFEKAFPHFRYNGRRAARQENFWRYGYM